MLTTHGDVEHGLLDTAIGMQLQSVLVVGTSSSQPLLHTTLAASYSVGVLLCTSDGRFGKKENDSIRFDSPLCQNLPRQSTLGVLDSGLKLLDQSTEAITGNRADNCLCRRRVATLPRMRVMTRSCSTVMHVANCVVD